MSAATALRSHAVRAVAHAIGSHIAPVGTFTVRRALPSNERHSVGPWVFLDHFGPYRAKPGEDGVGPHPHAGIETVTYLLSGRNEHRDSAGHTGIVAAGGAQWMTAGRGIVHAERPVGDRDEELTVHGIQLWTSLPRALKHTEPGYQRIDASAIPAVSVAGATVRVIAGEFSGQRGPARTLMPTFLWHVTIAPESTFEAALPREFEAAAYVIEGEGDFGGVTAGVGRIVVWKGEETGVRIANVSTKPLELMILGGAPAEGPLVFHGPFVMNTVDQVRAAEIAYRTGRMGFLEDE